MKKYQTDLYFKQLGKYGKQLVDEGIQFLDWSAPGQMTYCRGKENVV